MARPGPAGQRRELIAAVRHVLGDRRLHWLGVAIAILVAIATAVFAVFHEQPVEDALYTSVTAVTSIGFGDLSLLGESFGVKAFAMLVMVVGAVATAILIGIVADAFLSLRLARLAGGPPPPGRGDHVVVCGLGTSASACWSSSSPAASTSSPWRRTRTGRSCPWRARSACT